MYRALSNGANSNIPRMIPWRDWIEWHMVKELLFSPHPHLRCRGVQHVAAWRSRERVPHAVETTSQLVEVRLNDVGPAGCDVACPRRSEEELRLAYSTVIVRAVNGLTGHEQKTAYAVPVSSLAREIGLPTWLVDVRHEASHKQMPGIVILRLAADFLVDYLWRRYWAPQAEHLAFLWGAFDQLITRFKATSEVSSTLPPPSSNLEDKSTPPGESTSPASKNKRKRGDSDLRNTGSPDSTTPRSGAAESGATASASPRGEPSGRKRSNSVCSAATAAPSASEIAAQEIAFSLTPTALSWALVPLLADGGMDGHRGDESGPEGRGRGQGHLLPRSREKYPTPGSSGVDEREVARRVTNRWAALLNLFHARWRGFGAALLVRLVEALLHNATRVETGMIESMELTAPFASGGSGSSRKKNKKNNGRGGLERQAAFIVIWTRHLLSRRWHLRSSDARIRESLRGMASDFGQSPTFCQEDEVSWGAEEGSWADEPASPDVLRAAFFPMRELRDRCRGVLATLPAHTGSSESEKDGETKAGNAASTSSDAGSSRVVRKGPRDHWARAGVESVCDALDAALSGRQSSSECRLSPRDQVDGGCRSHQVTSSSTKLQGNEYAGTRPREAKRAPFDAGLSTGNMGAMMDLESLERFLALGEAAETLSGVSNVDSVAAKTGVVGEKSAKVGKESDAAWELVEDWTPCAIGTLPGWSAAPLSCGSPGMGVRPASETLSGVSNVDSVAAKTGVVGEKSAKVGRESDAAWELVEDWTPCAIGTLPGWSAAPLSCGDY